MSIPPPQSTNSSLSIDLLSSSSDDEERNESRMSKDSVYSTATGRTNLGIGHRCQSDVWILYTETNAPHKLKSAICRHYKLLVNHHKKSELARKHLLKCHDFRKFVHDLDDAEVPEWYPRKKRVSNRIKLPSRKQLANSLLDECYSYIKRQVNDHLMLVKSICIISDAWTNVVGEPVVNYLATSPTKTFFIESVATHDQSHNIN